MQKNATLLGFINDWKLVGMACLFLGLAPFVPEPHLLGKLRWVAGGAIGMQPLDWFDLVWHGFPWVLLLRLIFVRTLRWLKLGVFSRQT